MIRRPFSLPQQRMYVGSFLLVLPDWMSRAYRMLLLAHSSSPED